MTKFDYYWRSNKDWYYLTKNGDFVVREDAPEEAQESYRHYLQQKKERENRVLSYYLEMDKNGI